MLRRTCTACFGLLLLTGPSLAGTLRGTLSLRATGSTAERTDPTAAVVWLDSIPERTEQSLARGTSPGWFRRRIPEPAPVLLQSGQRFEPSVITVVVGRPLEVRNRDGVWHGAFSVSPANAFDLGKRPPGKVDSVRFEQPGVVPVRCDIHPEMSATVVVTPNHARARPDSTGRWRLPSLPRGRYVLRAWAPGRAELRREVAVPRSGFAEIELRW